MIGNHIKAYRSLNRNRVKYLVIGGLAANLYGVPRATKDMGLFIQPTLKNCQKLLKALIEAGFGTAYLTTPEGVLQKEVTIFEDYVRLDILLKPKGLSFDEVWTRRSAVTIQGTEVKFLSLDDLIKSKLATGRKADLEDVRILRKIRREKLK